MVFVIELLMFWRYERREEGGLSVSFGFSSCGGAFRDVSGRFSALSSESRPRK